MVAGTDRGIIGFNPRLLVEDKKAKAKPEAPIITMLRINGEIQTPESLSGKHMSADTQEDVIYTRYLDLGHESKNLFIVCRPRGFMTEITDQYYYQLRGHSNNWLPVTNNSLTLSNLVPGDYDLILRTGPQEDDTAEEFHMMHIRIRPPFWLSPWGMDRYSRYHRQRSVLLHQEPPQLQAAVTPHRSAKTRGGEAKRDEDALLHQHKS